MWMWLSLSFKEVDVDDDGTHTSAIYPLGGTIEDIVHNHQLVRGHVLVEDVCLGRQCPRCCQVYFFIFYFLNFRPSFLYKLGQTMIVYPILMKWVECLPLP